MSMGFYRVGSQIDPVRARQRLAAAMMKEAERLMLGIASPSPKTDPIPPTASIGPHHMDTMIDGEPLPIAPKLTAQVAKSIGFTGNTCTQCGSARMKVSGHCEVCEECGSSSGCS